MRRIRTVLVAAVAVAAALAIAFAVRAASDETILEVLPDLDQAAPGELSGRPGGSFREPRFLLGFDSAAANVGAGPLVVLGRRTRGQPVMQVRQQIRRSDDTHRTVDVPATLRYVRSRDHSHWHLLDFMQYELRRADGRIARPDRKTGFCLGDRYEVGIALERADGAEFTEECGKNQPELLRIVEGISVGYGDDYAAHLEGQEFDVTGLPAGRYLLVHRVNARRLLRESDYRNNAASMAFDLSWPQGPKSPPRIDVIARCPDSASCP